MQISNKDQRSHHRNIVSPVLLLLAILVLIGSQAVYGKGSLSAKDIPTQIKELEARLAKAEQQHAIDHQNDGAALSKQARDLQTLSGQLGETNKLLNHVATARLDVKPATPVAPQNANHNRGYQYDIRYAVGEKALADLFAKSSTQSIPSGYQVKRIDACSVPPYAPGNPTPNPVPGFRILSEKPL